MNKLNTNIRKLDKTIAALKDFTLVLGIMEQNNLLD